MAEGKNLDELKKVLDQAYAYATQDRDFDKALGICNEVIEAHPTTPDGWRERAAIYEYMDQLDKAITDITKVVQLGSKEPHDYFTRGRYHLDNGNNAEAVDDFTKTIELGDECDFQYYMEAAYFLRAIAYLRLGRYDEVLTDCEHVPNDYDWYVRSGMKSKADVVKEAEKGQRRSKIKVVKIED